MSTTGPVRSEREIAAADPVDRTALDSLAVQMESQATATGFATRFLDLLPARVSAIQVALAVGNADMAMDRVLSLKVTATVVGAHQLVLWATEIESGIRTGDLDRASAYAGHLGPAAVVTRRLLDDYVDPG